MAEKRGPGQNPQRRKQMGRPPPPKKNMDKATMRRFFGTQEFHFIKTCTHDIKRKGMCSFCKLIDSEAVSFLKEERVKKDMQRLQGFYRRAGKNYFSIELLRIVLLSLCVAVLAEMRYGLVREWSKNQLFRNKDSMQHHGAEIILCSKVGDCIGHFEDINKALDDIAQNLRKRIRVMEVGEFAAIRIQARVRGLLTRKRTRIYVLTRFQYNAANTR